MQTRRSFLGSLGGSVLCLALGGIWSRRSFAAEQKTLPFFATPANQAQRDLAEDPQALQRFVASWSRAMDGWSEQAIVGKPWNQTANGERTNYVNPPAHPGACGRDAGAGSVDTVPTPYYLLLC
jgi:hypothetical protein